MRKVEENIVIENAKIIFKNFKGEGGTYNREGDRNFCVVFDIETAEALADIGWNIKGIQKYYDAPEENRREPYMQVKVKFGMYPPKIVLINETDGKRPTMQQLDESSVGILDDVRPANVDLEIRPYNVTVNGQDHVAAYLKEMYVTQKLTGLAAKYADLDSFDEEDCPF